MTPPSHNDGPFVSNSRGPGLLRRLLGGGANDPTSPHTHDADLSTTQMHEQPLERTTQAGPVAPKASPFGAAGTDTFGGSRPGGTQRPLLIRTLVWLIKHPRIAVTLGALLLVFIGQFGGDTPSRLEQASADLQDMQEQITEDEFSSGDIEVAVPELATPTAPSAAPVEATQEGEFWGKVMKVRGEDVTVDSAAGTFTWKIDNPSVYAILVRNLDRQAFIHWELRGPAIYVDGVRGPKGTITAPDDGEPPAP